MIGSLALSPWAMMLIIMILGGALGGMANYLLKPANSSTGRSVNKSLGLGIVASLMVPLFLYVVSSKILDSVAQSSGTPRDMYIRDVLVFFGFCLVAGASSTAFIRTVSAQTVKELEEKVSNVQSDVNLMMAPQIEQEPSSEKALSLQPKQQLEEKAIRILKELANGQFLLRTRTSVAKETGFTKPEVDRIMTELARKGTVGSRIVVTKTGENRRRWFITQEGRAAISSPSPILKGSR
jgi:outer membrane murein-binding lipoprotein Lpp